MVRVRGSGEAVHKPALTGKTVDKVDRYEWQWIAADGEGSLLQEVLSGPRLALETWMRIHHDERSDDWRC